MTTTPPVFYTPEQVAAALQVAVRTVYAMIRRGELPVKRAGGRRYRIPEWGLKAGPLTPTPRRRRAA